MRPLFLLPYGLAALGVAVVVHLVSILLMPTLAPADALRRLAAGTGANRIEILPPVRPESMHVPFADPAVQLAVCRFDIAASPVFVRVRTADSFVSVTLLAPTGRVLYTLTDRAAVRGLIDLRLLTRAQLQQLEAGEAEGEPVQELRLELAETSGLVVIKALSPWPSLAAAAEETLAAARCDPAKMPE